MEEEADDLADFLEEEHIEYEGATDIFIDLQNQVKKQKEVIDKIEKYIEKQARMYGLSMPIELGTHLDNILGILNEVSE